MKLLTIIVGLVVVFAAIANAQPVPEPQPEPFFGVAKATGTFLMKHTQSAVNAVKNYGGKAWNAAKKLVGVDDVAGAVAGALLSEPEQEE